MSNLSTCRNITLDFNLDKAIDEYPNYVAAIIVILSLIANILVLRGIKLTKQRPLSYYFICNIAIAELIDTLAVPFALHASTGQRYWIFGKVMCFAVYLSSAICSLVVSFTLAAFAIYACSIIFRSPKRRPSACIVFAVMIFIWLLSVALTMPLGFTIFYQRENNCDTNLKRHICLFKVENKNLRYYLNVGPFICQTIIPFSVVVISYGFMLFIVKRLLIRSRRKRYESQSDTMEMCELSLSNSTKKSSINRNSRDTHNRSITSTSDSSGNENRKDSGQLQKMEDKLLRMIFWMAIVFVICYSPRHMTYFAWRSDWYIGKDINPALLHKLFVITKLLAKVIHPLCFGWSSGIIGRNFISCYKI